MNKGQMGEREHTDLGAPITTIKYVSLFSLQRWGCLSGGESSWGTVSLAEAQSPTIISHPPTGSNFGLFILPSEQQLHKDQFFLCFLCIRYYFSETHNTTPCQIPCVFGSISWCRWKVSIKQQNPLDKNKSILSGGKAIQKIKIKKKKTIKIINEKENPGR